MQWRDGANLPHDDPVVEAYYRQYFRAISERGTDLTARDRFGYFLDGLAEWLPPAQVAEIEADCQLQLIQGA